MDCNHILIKQVHWFQWEKYRLMKLALMEIFFPCIFCDHAQHKSGNFDNILRYFMTCMLEYEDEKISHVHTKRNSAR